MFIKKDVDVGKRKDSPSQGAAAPKIHSFSFRKGSRKETKGSRPKAINRKRNGEIKKRRELKAKLPI